MCENLSVTDIPGGDASVSTCSTDTVKCNGCDNDFKEDAEYREHIKTCQPLGLMKIQSTTMNGTANVMEDNKCAVCQHPSENVEQLTQHILQTHGGTGKGKEIKCPHCDLVCKEDKFIDQHIRERHYLKCGKCEEMLESENTLQEHVRKVHIVSCNHCNYESDSKEGVNKHTRSAHPGMSVVICGVCASSFVSVEECIGHINSHEEWCPQTIPEVPIFPCDQFPQCNQTFLNIRDLRAHKESIHGVSSLPSGNRNNFDLKFQEIRNYQDFYYRQMNITQLDQSALIGDLANRLSTQETTSKILIEECKRLARIIEQHESCLLYTSPSPRDS